MFDPTHQNCCVKYLKLDVIYSYSFGETSCGRPQSVPKRPA